MGIFSKSIGPVFLKDTSDADAYIIKLQDLLLKAEKENANLIQKQLSIAKYGKKGESDIAYELKNSGMDMYILHDIYLEYGDLSAQIDYLVITRKHTYVIECKNLIGNIKIDHTGAFIRKLSDKSVGEGIYSPITQNQRHLQVLKEVQKNSKGNAISKKLFEKNFENNHQSIIAFTNPKTCIDARCAPEEIKQQVIRADQLITYIKKKDAEPKKEMSNDAMFNLAKFYLEQNKPERFDYAKKYEIHLQDINKQTPADKITLAEKKITEDTDSKNMQIASSDSNSEKYKEDITKKLKEYRLRQSKAEGIKPYYIFNDAQMGDLLEKRPQTKEDLLKVSGFGNVKVEKYGEDIIKILQCR